MTRRTIGFLAGLLLLTSLAAGQEQRAPIPPAAEQKRTQALIRDLMKTDYARRSTEGRRTLARRLVTQADDSKSDPSTRYVLLAEAVEMATLAGDASTLLAALDALTAEYEVDAFAVKSEALLDAKRTVRTVEDARTLGQALLDLTEEALEADDYDVAKKMVRDTASLARKARDSGVSDRAAEITKELPALKRAYDDRRRAEKTLESDPDDGDANLALGLYYCFEKDDWEQGLPRLAKGSDATLKLLAGMELRKPAEAAERMALGDRWSNLATGKSGEDRERYASRALSWYEAALEGASSLQKLQLEKKIGEMTRLLDGGSGGRRRTLDLLRMTDPTRHALSGTWTKSGPMLNLAVGNGFSKIRFPVVPKGSYELEIHFTRKSGQWSIGPVLPVGDRSVGMTLSWNQSGNMWSGLTRVKRQPVMNNETRVDGKLEDNRRHVLWIRVTLQGRDKADIRVRLNGKPYVEWNGPVADLSPDQNFSVADPVSLGWVSYQSEIVFHAARLKMLTGAAEPVR